MQGDSRIIEALNAAVALEYRAELVYQIEEAHWADAAYVKIAGKQRKRSARRKRHARKLSRRLAFFKAPIAVDPAPLDFDQLAAPDVLLAANLGLEMRLRDVYRKAMGLCLLVNDHVSYDVCENNLKQVEPEIERLEALVAQAESMGRANFVQFISLLA